MPDESRKPPARWQPPMPPTSQKAVVEQARRTTPVQKVAAQVAAAGEDDRLTKAMADAVRKLLGRT